MSSSGESIATPLLRGVLAALGALLTAIAIVAVTALAAQLVAERSTATALDAILIALNILVLGLGGGIMLHTGAIEGAANLTPLGLTLVLIMVVALGMRRAMVLLDPVEDDGGLRPAALRDSGAALGALTVTFAIGTGLLAALGRSPDSSPVVLSAVVSGALIALLGGLAGQIWAVRAQVRAVASDARILDLLPEPYGALARSVSITMLSLLALGMAAASVMVLLGTRAEAALMDDLRPGIVGGIVLTLLHLALLPLFAVWALAVLIGGQVTLGTGTAYSLGGAQGGLLPALPLLGALPQPGQAPDALWLLVLLPAAAVALGAVRLVRDVAQLPRKQRIAAWVAHPLLVVVATVLLAGLATGSLGTGRLERLGPDIASLILPLLGEAVLATGAVLVVLASPLPQRARAAAADVRRRIESEEARHGASAAEPRSQGDTDPDDSDTDDASAAEADEAADKGAADEEPAAVADQIMNRTEN